MKEKTEFWVKNLSSADVNLGDLGVKILMGQVVDLYKSNPYLTKQQVERSIDSGSLNKRLSGKNPVLQVVKKPNISNSVKKNRLRINKEPVNIRRTKSSVLIENVVDDLTEDKAFDFADYGLETLKNSNVGRVRDQDSVLVKAKEDSKNSTTALTANKIIEDTRIKSTNPVGQLAETATKSGQPYTVTKPSKVIPKSQKMKKVIESDPVVLEKTDFDAKVVTKSKDDGAVVMEIKEVKPKKKNKV